MRIKARLKCEPLESSPPDWDWHDDHSLKLMSMLFPTDPIVTFDEESWYLSATVLDEADTPPGPNSYPEVQNDLVMRMNGIGKVLRGRQILRPLVIGQLEGYRSGTSVRINGIGGIAITYDGIDPVSTGELLEVAAVETNVRRVVELFGHLDPEWVWFDLYRLWEVMADDLGPALTTTENLRVFRNWVYDRRATVGDHVWDFEDSANNSALGKNRRHGGPGYKSYPHPKIAQPPTPMTSDAATQFIRKVIKLWIKEKYGVTVTLAAI